MRAGGTTLVDCRWFGRGGHGRVTEHFLRGLAADPPGGDWLLWGTVPPALRWSGAEIVPARHDPHDWYGQRALVGQPRADRAVWLHQYRPLRRSGRSEIGIIYDTIPLRWGSGGAIAAAQRAYYRRAAALCDRVVTASQFAKRTLVEDLRLSPQDVDVVPPPVDAASVERVVALRAATADRPHVLFLGRFAPHKNLVRLCAAFPRTRFSKEGGRLILAGGSAAEVRELRRVAGGLVTLRPHVPQDELERLLASAAALVQPSLEEGYGLPVAEALAAGIPVAAADAGALPEVADGRAALFDPLDVAGMAAAIDAAVVTGAVARRKVGPDADETFARGVLGSLERVVEDRTWGTLHRP